MLLQQTSTSNTMKTYIIGHQKPDLDSVVAAISFALYSKLNEVENPTPAIIDNLNSETKFVFEKFGLAPPNLITANQIMPEDRVILVDHNELDQRLVGLNQDQIIAIYDHHKVNLNFSLPIEICIMPFGSSNTVAWQLFNEIKYALDPQTASLMLCAVLSDTVGLKSSTTTDKDKLAVSSLSKIAGITNLDELTMEIFKAKSNISALTDEQVVLNDYKIFDFGGKKVLIGQTETVEQESLLSNRKINLLTALQSIKQKENVVLIFLAITDILKVNTKIILLDGEETEIAEKSFNLKSTGNILDIGPKMSRKKDIVPVIEKYLSSTKQ